MNKNNKLSPDLVYLSELLDNKFKLPFGIRIGLDNILGFIPVVGDSVSLIISSYILIRAIKIGFPSTILVRMFVNIIFDYFIGLVPLIGDFFDIAFKANIKNLKLMQKHTLNPRRTQFESSFMIGFILIFVGAVTFLTFYLLFKLLLS